MAIIAYLIAVIAANLTAAWVLPIPITTVGTLLFGATFTLRDMVHVRHGRRGVYLALGCAALLTALLSWLQAVEWRVLVASVVGMVLAETADTEVFQRVSGSWLRRVLWSNSISIPLDTLLFNSLAFLGVWSWGLWVAVSLGDMVTKFLIGWGVGYARSYLLRRR